MTTTQVNRRKGHRAFVTKALTSVRGLILSDDLENNNRLNGLRQTLVDKMEILSGLDDEILGNIEGEDDIAAEIDRSSEIRLQIQESISAIDEK